MAKNTRLTLETNIYSLKLTPIQLYRFEFQLSPNSNELRRKIIGKFIHINKLQLLDCSFSQEDIIFSTQPFYSLHLKTIVYCNNQAFRVHVTCKPIADSTAWIRDNLLILFVKFWQQHYFKFGKVFFDPSQALDTLELESVEVVAGFVFFLDNIRNEIKIIPRAFCIHDQSQPKLYDINALSRKDFDTYKRNDVSISLSYVTTAIQKLLSTGLTRFGIDLEKKQIPAYSLSPPPIFPSDSQGPFYHVPEGSHKWALFSFDPRYQDGDLELFRGAFTAQARKHGLDFEECVSCRYLSLDYREQIFNILDNLTQIGIKFALLGFSFTNPTVEFSELFLSIKFRLKQMKIPSQIVVTDEMDRYYDFKNEIGVMMDTLLIKLNIKLGGQVNTIDPNYFKQNFLDPSRTMLVGATISFKALTPKCSNSVAALISTIDNHWSKYEIEISVNCETDIGNLESMLTSLVQKYHTINGYYPESLIFIRHHFDTQVCEQEFATIQRVISKLNTSCQLAFVVATNCNNIRVDFVNDQDRTDGVFINENLENIQEDYFYLYDTHASRPTRYTIYRNQLHLESAQIRQLLFDLCHYTIRSFQVNRYPAPLEIAVRQCTKAMRLLEAKSVVFQDPLHNEDSIQQLLNGVRVTD